MSIDELVIEKEEISNYEKKNLSEEKVIPFYSKEDEEEYYKLKNFYDKTEYDIYKCAKKYIFRSENMFDEETYKLLSNNYENLSKDKNEINKAYNYIDEILTDVNSIYNFSLDHLKIFTKVAHNLIESGRYFNFENHLTLIKYHDELIDKCNNLITLTNYKLYSEVAKSRTKMDIDSYKKHIQLHKINLLVELNQVASDKELEVNNYKEKINNLIIREYNKLVDKTIKKANTPHNSYFLDYICERTMFISNEKKIFDKFYNILESKLKESKKEKDYYYSKIIIDNALGTLYKVKLLKDADSNRDNFCTNTDKIISKKKNLEKHFYNKFKLGELTNKHKIRLYSKILWDLSIVSSFKTKEYDNQEEKNKNFQKKLKNAKKYINKYSQFVNECEFIDKKDDINRQIKYLQNKYNVGISLEQTIHDSKGKDIRKEAIKKNGKRWNQKKKRIKRHKNSI